MKVKFLAEWQGSKVGDIGEFVPFITDDLLKRKIVEPYLDESKKDATIKKQAQEIDKLRKQVKDIKAAPVDKMVKGAAKSK